MLRTNPLRVATTIPSSIQDFDGVEFQIFSSDSWSEEGRHYIPKFDPHWQLAGYMTAMALAMDADMNILLTGFQGTGKTSSVRQLCAIRNQPLLRISCSETLAEDEFFGRYLLKDGETVWVSGPLELAAREGWAVILDEWDMARPQALTALRGLLETGSRHLVLMGKDGKRVDVHSDFRVFGTANSIGAARRGQFVGTNMMNPADLDRWDFTIRIDLPPVAAIKKALFSYFPDLPEGFVDNMLRVVQQVNANVLSVEGEAVPPTDYKFGMRAILKWAKAYMLLKHPLAALMPAVLETLSPYEFTAIQGVAQRVFGSDR